MAELDLDAAEARAAAADHAPWRVVQEHGRDISGEGWSRLTIETDAGVGAGKVVAELADPDAFGSAKRSSENAEFIAHARTDVELMAAEIRQLRDAAAAAGQVMGDLAGQWRMEAEACDAASRAGTGLDGMDKAVLDVRSQLLLRLTGELVAARRSLAMPGVVAAAVRRAAKR